MYACIYTVTCNTKVLNSCMHATRQGFCCKQKTLVATFLLSTPPDDGSVVHIAVGDVFPSDPVVCVCVCVCVCECVSVCAIGEYVCEYASLYRIMMCCESI